jgi:hypothetical protein
MKGVWGIRCEPVGAGFRRTCGRLRCATICRPGSRAGPATGETDTPLAGSWRRWLRRLLKSPLYRVEQELGLSGTDRLSASLKIPVRISERMLQLSDAVDKETHVAVRRIRSTVSAAHQPFTSPAAWLLQLGADVFQPAIYSESPLEPGFKICFLRRCHPGSSPTNPARRRAGILRRGSAEM